MLLLKYYNIYCGNCIEKPKNGDISSHDAPENDTELYHKAFLVYF